MSRFALVALALLASYLAHDAGHTIESGLITAAAILVAAQGIEARKRQDP